MPTPQSTIYQTAFHLEQNQINPTNRQTLQLRKNKTHKPQRTSKRNTLHTSVPSSRRTRGNRRFLPSNVTVGGTTVTLVNVVLVLFSYGIAVVDVTFKTGASRVVTGVSEGVGVVTGVSDGAEVTMIVEVSAEVDEDEELGVLTG